MSRDKQKCRRYEGVIDLTRMYSLGLGWLDRMVMAFMMSQALGYVIFDMIDSSPGSARLYRVLSAFSDKHMFVP